MQLGKLEAVDVRSVFEHEARDFTPWLLDHQDHLAEALGIELELQHSEHPVGGFSLDLIGQDFTNDAVLIVENQLAVTDHSHLGQILTYAAGTDAATIIWIATGFRDEHRQAIDWLNEQTGEGTHFFGIELRLVRIGESEPAPDFRVVAQPNDWQKQVRTVTTGSRQGTKSAMYQTFWARYLTRVHELHPDWTRASKPSPQNWMTFKSPIKGTALNPSFAHGNRLRHEIYIDSGDGERNTEVFEALLSQRVVMETAYGRLLEFEELPAARASRVAEYLPTVDVRDEDRHEEFVEWIIDATERMRRALAAVDVP